MELFDDWGSMKRIESEPRSKGQQPASADAIRGRLANFTPRIVNVHCYKDVGYPWVQVVFEEVVHPNVALQLGDALAEVAGADCVYLNSLRPMAVFFLLEPAFDPQPDLPASRYGARLADIKESWSQPQAMASSPDAPASAPPPPRSIGS